MDYLAQFWSDWIAPHKWQMAGVLLCPYIAFRAGNWFRKTCKRLGLRKKPWHFLMWQACTGSVMYFGCMFCFSKVAPPDEARFWSIAVVIASAVIIDMVIRLTDNPKTQAVHDALTKGVILTDDHTVMNTVMGLATGAKVKPDERIKVRD